MEEKSKQIIEITGKLLSEKNYTSPKGRVKVELLAGDGSERCFFRMNYADGSSLVAILPSEVQLHGMEEAKSSITSGQPSPHSTFRFHMVSHVASELNMGNFGFPFLRRGTLRTTSGMTSFSRPLDVL